MNPETLQALKCVVEGVGLPLIIYGSLIVGTEIGGMTQGYPGRGREIHEQIMKQLKQTFFGNKNNRKK